MKGPTKWKNRGELQSRRRARRGRTPNFYRRRENSGENFEPVHDGNYGQIWSLSRNCRACGRTKLTGVRTTWRGIQVGTKVELRRQEDDSEQQSAKSCLIRVNGHLSTFY